MTRGGLFLFLRAVNLGRVNRVPMKQLVARIEEAGLPECGFLLQSGNLVFRGEVADRDGLKSAVEGIIRDRFGVETVAIARTPDELHDLLNANPFDEPEGGSIHIVMWDGRPREAALRQLAEGEYGEDRLFLTGRAAIIRYAGISHASRLTNALIERRLEVPATSRNIRTLDRLLALVGSP